MKYIKIIKLKIILKMNRKTTLVIWKLQMKENCGKYKKRT